MVDAAASVGCMLDIPEVVMGTLVLAAGTSVGQLSQVDESS
jgi:sodium/potassium/calcium exchanger 5